MGEQTNPADVGSVFSRGFLLLFLASGLCLALLALLDRSTGFDLASMLENPWLWAAIPMQLTGLALFVLAWFLLLNRDSQLRISWTEASAHIGITLMGKYLPGKVWGLLGRSYLLTRKGVSGQHAAELLLADQFLTFYSGILVGSIALALAISYPAGLVLLFAAAISIPAVLSSYNRIVGCLIQLGHRLFKNLTEKVMAGNLPAGSHSLALPLLVYLAHWLLISVVLCVLFLPALSSNLPTNALLVIAAIPLGMLAGFLALWAPGGIGVREAVIVAILAVNLDLELAGSIAITYRLICVANDLLMGVIALLHYRGGISDSPTA